VPRWLTRTLPTWLVLLAGCALTPPLPPAPATAPASPLSPPATEPTAETALPLAEPWLRARARWVPVDWSALPGWQADRSAEIWPALRAGCVRPALGWAALCARASAFAPPDDGFARDFLQRELQAYRVESLDGDALGLATGYFEPLVTASRLPRPGFLVPLHRPPPDLAQRRPYWSRQQLDILPAAAASLRGQEIAYVASALDVLVLQIQGSGRLRITEPDGRAQVVRVAYAGSNDQPYRSVGRWLIEQGELRLEGASWPAIRDWGQRASPERLQQMMWSNPRVVFFREEALPDAATPQAGGSPAGTGNARLAPTGPTGPKGAQGVPLSAGRSVAVDPQAVPYGTPLWIDTTEPLSATPLRRLVMAQDTGSAITGAVRVDYFWGSVDGAEQQAGRMKQPLRVWALWPRQGH
jgi:membrane-bound lytic murein transglycosylase A